MKASYSQALQHSLSRWQYFAPCPGANITIIDSELGSWSGASGYADIDADTPLAMPVNAQCYIYSITKSFTAVRILQLAAENKLALDDQVANYLPDVALRQPVTIRQLLNHTSGLPNYTELPDYLSANRASPETPWSFAEVAARTCRAEPDFPAGEGWHYSNTGYMLLHRLIEVVSGESYADSIERTILRLFNLQQTQVATEINQGALLPGYCPYLNDLMTMENIVTSYHPGWCLTGLMSSTTETIARFYTDLFAGKLLDDTALAEMQTSVLCEPDGGNKQAHPFFVKPGYGLGLMIDPEWGHGGLYGHGGDGPGFNTWAMYLPDFHGRQVTLVVFCNASIGGHPFQLCRNLLRVLVSA